MTTHIKIARRVVEFNKTFVLDSISKKYAELFKAIEDYNYISINGKESEEQELCIEINYLLTELNITEDDAKNLFEEYEVEKEDN